MTEYDNTNRGVLFVNNRKERDSQPDRTGSLNVGGVEYFIDGWLKKSRDGAPFLSLSIKQKDKQPSSAPAPAPRPAGRTHADRPGGPNNRLQAGSGFDDADDIPF